MAEGWTGCRLFLKADLPRPSNFTTFTLYENLNHKLKIKGQKAPSNSLRTSLTTAGNHGNLIQYYNNNQVKCPPGTTSLIFRTDLEIPGDTAEELRYCSM